MGDRDLEKQEKSIDVACPKCKGTHILKMLLEKPSPMAGKDLTVARSENINRHLGAILVCPKTHKKFHTSIVLRVEDYWDIKLANEVS